MKPKQGLPRSGQYKQKKLRGDLKKKEKKEKKR
jgi:hypothetical protein